MSEKELFKASNRPDGDLERVIIAAVDPDITLKGLRILYERNVSQ